MGAVMIPPHACLHVCMWKVHLFAGIPEGTAAGSRSVSQVPEPSAPCSSLGSYEDIIKVYRAIKTPLALKVYKKEWGVQPQ